MLPWPRPLPHLKCSPTNTGLDEHWNGEAEHRGADGAGQRPGTTIRGRHTRREEPDPRRVRGRHGLPSQARDAHPAVRIDRERRRRARQQAHLRRRGPQSAGGSLGGVGPHLRQASEGADADAGGGHGEARPPAARAGDPCWRSGDERVDHRPLAARDPGTGRRQDAAADGSLAGAQHHPGAHVLGLGRPAAGLRGGRSRRAQRAGAEGQLRSDAGGHRRRHRLDRVRALPRADAAARGSRRGPQADAVRSAGLRHGQRVA